MDETPNDATSCFHLDHPLAWQPQSWLAMPRPTSQYEPRDPSDSVLANLARDYLPALCEALAVGEGDEMEAADEMAPPGLCLPDARPS